MNVSSDVLAGRVRVGQQAIRPVKRVVVSMFCRQKTRSRMSLSDHDAVGTSPTESMVSVPPEPKLIMMSAVPVYNFLKVRGVTAAQTFRALRMALSTSGFCRSGV